MLHREDRGGVGPDEHQDPHHAPLLQYEARGARRAAPLGHPEHHSALPEEQRPHPATRGPEADQQPHVSKYTVNETILKEAGSKRAPNWRVSKKQSTHTFNQFFTIYFQTT